MSCGSGTLFAKKKREIKTVNCPHNVSRQVTKYLLDKRFRVQFLWIHHSHKPSFEEVREPDLPRDEIGIEKLNLVRELLRVYLAHVVLFCAGYECRYAISKLEFLKSEKEKGAQYLDSINSSLVSSLHRRLHIPPHTF